MKWVVLFMVALGGVHTGAEHFEALNTALRLSSLAGRSIYYFVLSRLILHAAPVTHRAATINSPPKHYSRHK